MYSHFSLLTALLTLCTLTPGLFASGSTEDKKHVEKDYSSVPLQYTTDDLAKYNKRTKSAILQNARTVLTRNTDDANWCDVLDAVIMDAGLQVSKKHHATLDPVLRSKKDHMDVYFAVAAQIPTFSDIITEGPCKTMTRKTHSDVLKGLEEVARNSFQDAIDAADKDGKEPLYQFGVIREAVKHLAEFFKKDFA